MLQFLTLHPSAFGLDISDFSLKIISLKKQKKSLAVASYGRFPIEKGIIEKGEIKKEKELAIIIKKAVQNVKGDKLVSHHAVVSLPEEKAFLQVMQLPKMKREEAVQAVNFEAENYIPFPIDKVYIDFEIIPPVHNHLDHLDILLASLPRVTVDSYIYVIKAADLVPVVLENESIATSRAVIKNGLTPTPVLVADIGVTRTHLSIYSGYSVRFATSVPISSELFTATLSKVFKVEAKQAEKLWRKKESKVFEALVPAMTDVSEQIKRYIDYYESHAGHQHLSGKKLDLSRVLLCGGGANLAGLPEFLSKTLQVETVLADPWVNILPAHLSELPPLSFQESLSYTTALVLALRGINQYD